MSAGRFVTSRADGRTDAEVIVALVQGVAPGTVVTYREMAEALSMGSNRRWDDRAVQSSARSSARRLLRETARVLIPVRGAGYRISQGFDHHGLALRRESKANNQLRMAVDVLRHVDYGEMTAEQRSVHEAHLTITGALFHQMCSVTSRQKRQDAAIQSLIARVDKLERSDE